MTRDVGKMRQSAVITTFSVGAMVDFVHGSFMTMGLDEWQTPLGRNSVIDEASLCTDLGVDELKRPPLKESNGLEDGWVDCNRFPNWLVCSNRRTATGGCGRLGKVGANRPGAGRHDIFSVHPDSGKVSCISCMTNITNGIGIPARFVCVCCQDKLGAGNTPGHIEDFPWEWWCHHGTNCPDNGILTLRETDGLSFSSMVVSCSCNRQRNLNGIFGAEFNKTCSGNIPWFGQKDSTPCGSRLKVFQRGASSIHSAVTRTYISIPDNMGHVGEDVRRYHQEFCGHVRIVRRYGGANINIRDVATEFYQDKMVPSNFESLGHDKNSVIDILIQNADTIDFVGQANIAATLIARKELEFTQLSKVVGGPRDLFQTVEGIGKGKLHPSIDSVMLVQRLREVTAFEGFTRDTGTDPNPDDAPGNLNDGIAHIFKRGGNVSRAHPHADKPRWLPAIDLRGEGIFVRLNGERLRDFSRKDHVKARLEKISDRINRSKSINLAKDNGAHRVPFDLEMIGNHEGLSKILVAHTMSHLLLRELTLECGYSSASLKERLYIDDNCFGFLIYASTPGADGTRGGLVRMGRLDRLKPVFVAAIEKARWCSSDPVCATCEGQGKEGLNLAACHACALIPETSCELGGHMLGNLLLDRCLVANSAAGSNAGFFDF